MKKFVKTLTFFFLFPQKFSLTRLLISTLKILVNIFHILNASIVVVKIFFIGVKIIPRD